MNNKNQDELAKELDSIAIDLYTLNKLRDILYQLRTANGISINTHEKLIIALSKLTTDLEQTNVTYKKLYEEGEVKPK